MEQSTIEALAKHVVETTPPGESNAWIGMNEAQVQALEAEMVKQRSAGVVFKAKPSGQIGT